MGIFVSVGCVQDVPTEKTEQIGVAASAEPTHEPVVIEPPVVVEEQEEKETKQVAKEEQGQAPEVVIPEPAKLTPIPVYQAYLVTESGAIFGIPSVLQGEGHKEQLTVADTDGNTLQGKISIYTVRGMLYAVREWVDQVGTEHTDYYAQDLSAIDVPKIELVDSVPKMPDVERVVFDSPEWLIKSVVLSGIEYSYLYNRHASVWGGSGDGEWVCRKNKITGYVVLENGLLITSEDGAQFCPANRKGLNVVGECGRVWK
jgi:hypothetical protein